MCLLINSLSTGPKIKELLSMELRQVLLNVFMKLSDSNYFKQLCGLNYTPLPTVTPFNTSLQGIQNALGFIQVFYIHFLLDLMV